MDRIQDVIDYINEKRYEEHINVIKMALGIVLGVCAIAAIAFAVYRYFTPDYLKDFDDEDFEDDFDAYFEDEDTPVKVSEETKKVIKEAEEAAEEVKEAAGAAAEAAEEAAEEAEEKAEE